MSKINKGMLDRYTEKIVSRKFLAWITATILAGIGFLDSGDWIIITLTYIGAQAAIDAAKCWKSEI
jgi:hypothetical protein